MSPASRLCYSARAAAAARSLPLLLALCLGFTASGCSESKAASSGATPKASVGACGDKGLPDCPLQNWMKSTVRPYLNGHDTSRLTAALEQLAEHAPAGYEGWQKSALAAAAAARKDDTPAIKAECKHCHDQHRERFRKERRMVALF